MQKSPTISNVKDHPQVSGNRGAHTPPESLGNAAGRNRLIGRRILVVGGGQTDIGEVEAPIGNGRAISLLFSREGAQVAVVDRTLDAAQATVAMAVAGRAFPIVADVKNEVEIERMVRDAHEKLGGLDGIVLNVGIGPASPWLEGVTLESWNLVLSVNLTSHMLTLKYAFPLLDDAASLVFISSVAGLTAGSRLPAYDASKAALAGLCRHVAYEGARRGIRANIVAPGLMDTPLGRVATRARPARNGTKIPLGRQGTGWETAYAALFLISEESAYVTGQILAVDGGLSGL